MCDAPFDLSSTAPGSSGGEGAPLLAGGASRRHQSSGHRLRCTTKCVLLHRVNLSRSTHERIADEVRRQRHRRNWTLDAAAPRLGISRRLLAQIESGTANPSLSTLLAIAAGFDIALTDLLSEDAKPSIATQAAKSDAPVLWASDLGSEARLLVGSGSLELWEWTMQPSDERRSGAHRATSREALLVTEGAITVGVGPTDTATVSAGQSAAFHADDEHWYRNDTDRVARFILAVNEPAGTLE